MLAITEPTLLLDESRCRANIGRMATKAARSQARFRPHFKTHQSRAIGQWYKDEGVVAITVSSVKMADYFSATWRDITIAVPFNVLEIDRINRIDARCRLNLCVMYPATLEFLEAQLERQVGIWIKVDVGYHRTGLSEDDDCMDALMDMLADSSANAGKLEFQGFLAHAGYTYSARSVEEIVEIDTKAKDIMTRLQDRYSPRFPLLQISLGDTPGCSIIEDFKGVDELRPGNLVFYDLTQHSLGSCRLGDIAVAMACPIIAKHQNKLIVHGGGAHFAKDFLIDEEGQMHYGLAVSERGDDWSGGWGEHLNGLRLTLLSQEHGSLTGPPQALDGWQPGDVVLVLPVHSCMTANSMKAYTTLDNQRILHLEAEYPLAAP